MIGPSASASTTRAIKGAPRFASRSSSSPAVSSGPIAMAAVAAIPPASIRGVIRMTVTPVCGLSVLNGPCDRGRTPIGRQDRPVKVDAAQSGNRQQGWGEDLAIRGGDQQIGVQTSDQFEAFGLN